jgi:hypothetical protein
MVNVCSMSVVSLRTLRNINNASRVPYELESSSVARGVIIIYFTVGVASSTYSSCRMQMQVAARLVHAGVSLRFGVAPNARTQVIKRTRPSGDAARWPMGCRRA